MTNNAPYKSINLDTDITYLKGVGPRRANVLKNSQINYIGDLFYYLPRKYIDRSVITKMNIIKIGQNTFVVGKVINCNLQKTRKRKTLLFT